MESADVPSVSATLARYQALIGVSEALRAYHDRAELFRSLARELRPVVRFDFLGLALQSETTPDVVPFVLEASGEVGPLPELTDDDQLTHWVLRHRKALVIPSVDDEARFAQEMEYLRRQKARSVCCLPLLTPRRSVGMLLAASRELHTYGTEDIAFLSLVANQVALAVDDALNHDALQESLRRERRRAQALAAEVDSLGGHRCVVTGSPPWTAVLKQATQVAATGTTVLLTGESGTGKEVVARFIHRASARADAPFVAINCAALPEHLLESELFGFERGAFTGAMQAKPGQLELADGGVLFLDEVGELTPSAQAKVLRVLQEGEVERVGGAQTLAVDVRVLAATNKDLEVEVKAGRFREDLWFRLAVIPLRMPALRERREDIALLARHFLEGFRLENNRPPLRFTPAAEARLAAQPWPGNVRELQNAVERLAIMAPGPEIDVDDMDRAPSGPVAAPRPDSATAPAPSSPAAVLAAGGLVEARRRFEIACIRQALEESGGNVSQAARALGIDRTNLHKKIQAYGLETPTQGETR